MRVRLLIPRRKPRKLVSRARKKRSGRTTAAFLLFGIAASLYALVGDSGLVAVMRMRARATQLRYEIAAAERANDELRNTIRPLREGDPAAIEREARERLYMVRPGDTLYMLPPELEPTAPTADPSGSPTAPSVPSGR